MRCEGFTDAGFTALAHGLVTRGSLEELSSGFHGDGDVGESCVWCEVLDKKFRRPWSQNGFVWDDHESPYGPDGPDY